MKQSIKVKELRFLISWGKYLKHKYLVVEPARKEFYKISLEETLQLIRGFEIYSGDEKEYSISEVVFQSEMPCEALQDQCRDLNPKEV
jgi:hypothetical protein